MAQRRTLIEGISDLKSTETLTQDEREFVYGPKRRRQPSAPKPAPTEITHEQASQPPLAPPLPATPTATAIPTNSFSPIGRVPVTIRMRADLASLLKRASLERQLQGVEPNSLQDIVETAIEPWLRSHNYLT